MLLREEAGGGLLAVAQPDHAALAGRLAAAWDDPLPADLVLATTRHDDVWAARDAAPPFNPGTGRPFDLFELDDAERVRMWSRVAGVAAPLGPEAAVWVLRHAERLHQDDDEAAVKAMAAAISADVAERVDVLRAAGGPRFDDAELARGTALLALFDTFSLRLCFGVRAPVAAGVLRLTPSGGVPAGTPDDVLTVAPWPFRGLRLDTHVQARRLPSRLPDQAALDAAWAATEPFALPLTLRAP